MDGYELRKIIGIDALKLVGFQIYIVNKNKFQEAERKKLIEVEYINMPNNISSIKIINDSLFKSLRWEKTTTCNKIYEQSVLELTVPKSFLEAKDALLSVQPLIGHARNFVIRMMDVLQTIQERAVMFSKIYCYPLMHL